MASLAPQNNPIPSTSTSRNGGPYTALIPFRLRGAVRYAQGSSMTDPKGVTERECYIIAQALYEFVRSEQSKPIEERRMSDEQDAKAILHARFDNELAILVKSDEAAGRQPPDCWRKASIGG